MSNKFNLYSVNLEPDPKKEPKTELCAMKIRHFIIHFFSSDGSRPAGAAAAASSSSTG